MPIQDLAARLGIDLSPGADGVAAAADAMGCIRRQNDACRSHNRRLAARLPQTPDATARTSSFWFMFFSYWLRSSQAVKLVFQLGPDQGDLSFEIQHLKVRFELRVPRVHASESVPAPRTDRLHWPVPFLCCGGRTVCFTLAKRPDRRRVLAVRLWMSLRPVARWSS